MSVFQPTDPRVGNERRKALLAKLAARFGGPSGVGQSPGGAGVGASGSPFHGFSRGGAAALTQLPHELPPQLAALLGPGGIGRSMASEHSAAFGAPVVRPHPSAPIAPPGPPQGMPTPPIPPVPTPVGPPSSSPVGASAPGPGKTPAVDSGIAPTGVKVAAAPGVETTQAGPVPLGNGLFYDPIQDVVINPQTGAGMTGYAS